MTQISNNLKNLPEETLTHISSYLSPRSALSLALTSSKLQPAAESRLLRILRISESDLYAPTYNAPTPPLPIVTTPTLVGRTDTETSGEGNRVVFHRALASRRVIRSFLVKLEMKNYRRGYVRELEFSMRHEIPLEFGSLMKLVQGSLERLVLSFPVHSSASLPMEGFTTLPRILLPLREFHALREVRLNISRGWTKSVLTILQVAPRLESLNVRGSPPVPLDPDLSPTRIYGQPQLEHTLLDPDSPRSVLTMGEVQGVQGGTAGQGGVERSGREEQNQRDQQQPQLDIWRDGGGWDIPKLQLRHLVVDGIQGLMSPILSRLIRSADQLIHLCLRDRSMLFSPPSDWNVLDAITSLPRLKRLDIPWTIHEFLEKRDWQGLEGVEEMRVAWDYVTLRSKSDKGTIFPRLSTIQKYTVEIVAYTPQWVYENVSQPWHHQMSTLRTMACVLEKEIIHLPALQTVLS
ncbi:hypothetical protein TREMEDRAFT_63521 [Tremella mesenterica DSM 1558]|uniref:uncharacterized protein n=1 Tax=Tremella mesenterica (strain ATCC 24925 / CBS 8224 / DSM 1558 / NBRC 9311 / NRRL Y-6157 / RJB 2259-6 / UBC 559-6) TaxID=578456 RepID=UPI0003F499DD|nr:uncharacterized protein TREMEDRAFT_63521 [Tremella mesenterica DSM 1558]EIW68351.1 hypothetical protein TREMEDRAFT_63521 [Tremella mesenterica DSM 1558]